MRRQAYKMCIRADVIKYVNAKSFKEAIQKAYNEDVLESDEIILKNNIEWIEEVQEWSTLKLC